MPGTHHQLFYHLVFSTKNRKPYLQPDSQAVIFEYLGGTVRGLGAVPIRIGGWVDHVHLFIKMKTTHCLADFMRQLKANTAKHFNQTSEKLNKFGWQDGYGAFTVSPSQKPQLIRYIDNQPKHHARETFQREYLRLLELHEAEFDERFLWD